MNKKLHIGLIDSGCDSLTCKGYFLEDRDSQYVLQELKHDKLKHGTTIANIITDEFATFTCMQIFDKSLTTNVGKIAFAIEYLCTQNVGLIHMSFGLKNDREVLRHAIQKAHQQNILLIASSPTLSNFKVFPASYKEVIAVTADARCSYDEISFLDSQNTLFGASSLATSKQLQGSSIAAAHITKEIAKLYYNGVYKKDKLLTSLQKIAKYKTTQKTTLQGVQN